MFPPRLPKHEEISHFRRSGWYLEQSASNQSTSWLSSLHEDLLGESDEDHFGGEPEFRCSAPPTPTLCCCLSVCLIPLPLNNSVGLPLSTVPHYSAGEGGLTSWVPSPTSLPDANERGYTCLIFSGSRNVRLAPDRIKQHCQR